MNKSRKELFKDAFESNDSLIIGLTLFIGGAAFLMLVGKLLFGM